jgi:hypothetical protein
VLERSDPVEPNMALTSWKGSRVRKQDVIIAKNYLSGDEMDSLNRLVVIFLEQAELRVKRQKDLTLEFWRNNVDRMLDFNDRPILEGAGSVSRENMEKVAYQRYDEFDQQRRISEAKLADEEDLKELEQLEDQVKSQARTSDKNPDRD